MIVHDMELPFELRERIEKIVMDTGTLQEQIDGITQFVKPVFEFLQDAQKVVELNSPNCAGGNYEQIIVELETRLEL